MLRCDAIYISYLLHCTAISGKATRPALFNPDSREKPGCRPIATSGVLLQRHQLLDDAIKAAEHRQALPLCNIDPLVTYRLPYDTSPASAP
jgi:hypothetical protein